jgi:hypothetical protein
MVLGLWKLFIFYSNIFLLYFSEKFSLGWKGLAAVRFKVHIIGTVELFAQCVNCGVLQCTYVSAIEFSVHFSRNS